MVKIFRAKEIEAKSDNGSIFEREIVSDKFGVKNFFVHLESLSPGGNSKYHYHEKKETVFFVLKGNARLFIDDEEYEVGPEDVIIISPGEKHMIKEVLSEEEFTFLEVGSPILEDKIFVDD